MCNDDSTEKECIMTTQSVSFDINTEVSVAENIIEYLQGHENEFSSALFSKHDQQDLRYQFATGSLNVDMVELSPDSKSGYATVSYGIHFFWPCNNQDEIDTYNEKLHFTVDNGKVCFELVHHEPWIVL